MAYYLEIALDKPRKLRFNHNAMADIEEATGVGLQKFITRQQSFAFLRRVLWATSRWEDPLMTLEAAGDLMDAYMTPKEQGGQGGNIDELADVCVEACRKAGVMRSVSDIKDAKAKAELEEKLARPLESSPAPKPTESGEPAGTPLSLDSPQQHPTSAKEEEPAPLATT